jgi:hypothetical protein
MFSVVDAVLLRRFRSTIPDRWSTSGRLRSPAGQLRLGRRLSGLGPAHDDVRVDRRGRAGELNLAGDGEPERISGLRMSPSGPSVLRAPPVLGRTFAPDEDQPGKNTVIVLTARALEAPLRRRTPASSGAAVARTASPTP